MKDTVAVDSLEKAKEVRTPKKREAFVYLGPNIAGEVLFSGSVFSEIPKHLDCLFERIPEVKELFVEARLVPKFKIDILRQGSEAFRLFQIVSAAADGMVYVGGVN